MLNRRFVLLGATALLGGCAARAGGNGNGSGGTTTSPPPVTGSSPTSGPLQTASPGTSWTGDPLSGYTSGAAPVTPTTMVGATTNRPMPMAHWFTVPLQSFCDDFTVHVFAGAPNGIASVEFFHENPTTTIVTAPQHNTVVNGTLPTAIQYNTFAITLPASAWCNDATKGGGTKQGATLYAKITAKPVAGVTISPRIIGPLRICPRFPINGLPNDKVILVTPDGKDNAGATVTAPSNGVVVSTLAAAELLIGNGGTYASAFNPLVKFMKTATYDVVNQRAASTFAKVPTCYWTLTHAPGVVATLSRLTQPSYSWDAAGNVNHWHWLMMRGLVEFRGSGLIIDHKNIAQIKNDSGGSNQVGGAAFWDNHCKHTLIGVAAVTDPTSGLSSPMYNTYWGGGPHPAFGGFAANNNVEFTPGSVNTGATCEWVGGGGGQSNIVLEAKCRETRGNMGVSNEFIVGTYSRGQVTAFFNPGTPGLFTIQGPTGSTVDFTGDNGTVWPNSTTTLTLHDGAGSQAIVLGIGPGDANHSVAQLVATIKARSGWTASEGTASSVYGWAARWGQPENGVTGLAVSSPHTFNASQPVHTEWYHNLGLYTVAGSGRLDNILIMNNVQRRPVRWGSATYQAEGDNVGNPNTFRMDNSYVANNYLEDNLDGDGQVMSGGSFSVVANNTHDIAEYYNNPVQGTDGTVWVGNISASMSGAAGATTTILKGNLAQAAAGMHAIDASNTDMSSGNIAGLYVNQALGDVRPGGSSIIAAHLFVSPEPYDLLGNLRDPTGDYPGAVSKNQTIAPVWPF
jgi:hypothetical protein